MGKEIGGDRETGKEGMRGGRGGGETVSEREGEKAR